MQFFYISEKNDRRDKTFLQNTYVFIRNKFINSVKIKC